MVVRCTLVAMTVLAAALMARYAASIDPHGVHHAASIRIPNNLACIAQTSLRRSCSIVGCLTSLSLLQPDHDGRRVELHCCSCV